MSDVKHTYVVDIPLPQVKDVVLYTTLSSGLSGDWLSATNVTSEDELRASVMGWLGAVEEAISKALER